MVAADTWAASWKATGGKPTAGHAAWGKARVHLATDLPAGQFERAVGPHALDLLDRVLQVEERRDFHNAAHRDHGE